MTRLEQPKISVILAVLNMRTQLSRAIESVIHQNYSNYELIIMDGQSTDGTLDVIKKYEPFIAYWESSQDKGHCDACNKALERATGDFIVFLNADDAFVENAFCKVIAAYQKDKTTKLISGGAAFYNEKKYKTNIFSSATELSLTLSNILKGMPLINARFFHHSIFKDYGKFNSVFIDGSYHVSNDRYFLANLALHHTPNTVVAEEIYQYYIHERSQTFSLRNRFKIYHEHLWLAQYLLENFSLTLQERKIVEQWERKESVTLFYHGLVLLKGKEVEFALKDGFLKNPIQWAWTLFCFPFAWIKRKFIK